jgi:hypothetical protein
VSGAVQESSKSVIEAYCFGQVTCELSVRTSKHLRASEDELLAVARFARRQIKNHVAPALEALVVEEELPISDSSHTHATSNSTTRMTGATLTSRVDCEVVSELSGRVKERVLEVVKQELEVPLLEEFGDSYNDKQSEQHVKDKVQAVRSMLQSLSRHIS